MGRLCKAPIGIVRRHAEAVLDTEATRVQCQARRRAMATAMKGWRVRVAEGRERRDAEQMACRRLEARHWHWWRMEAAWDRAWWLRGVVIANWHHNRRREEWEKADQHTAKAAAREEQGGRQEALMNKHSFSDRFVAFSPTHDACQNSIHALCS